MGGTHLTTLNQSNGDPEKEFKELVNEMLAKDKYTIRDVAKVFRKKTHTVRSWERKGIIEKPYKEGQYKWRYYTRYEFCSLLEDVLDYKWERVPFFNGGQVQTLVFILRKNGGYNK